MLTFTLGEFVDAMEKNGLPQGIGHTFNYYDNVREGDACAIGQGYWNLMGQPDSVDIYHEDEFWNQVHRQLPGFPSYITGLNDYEKYTIPEICHRVRDVYSDRLDQVITIEIPEI
jgi:hypothetical protein